MYKQTLMSIFLVMGVSPVLASGSFDGANPLLCATVEANQCLPGTGCTRLTNAGADVPTFFRIDLKKGQVTGSYQGQTTGVSTIERVEHVDGKLMLGGAEDGVEGVRDGVGWSMAVVEATGEFTLAGAGDGEAFSIFGNCSLIK